MKENYKYESMKSLAGLERRRRIGSIILRFNTTVCDDAGLEKGRAFCWWKGCNYSIVHNDAGLVK